MTDKSKERRKSTMAPRIIDEHSEGYSWGSGSDNDEDLNGPSFSAEDHSVNEVEDHSSLHVDSLLASNSKASASFDNASTHSRNSTLPKLLDNQGSQDLQTLMNLLDLQMDAQQRIIDSLVDHLQHQNDSTVDTQLISSSLNSSALQIRGTVEKITHVSEVRDEKWKNKWKKERENRIRWEEVVKNVSAKNLFFC